MKLPQPPHIFLATYSPHPRYLYSSVLNTCYEFFCLVFAESNWEGQSVHNRSFLPFFSLLLLFFYISLACIEFRFKEK